MRVYVVMCEIQYECSYIIAIYDNAETANKHIKELDTNRIAWNTNEYSVHDFNVFSSYEEIKMDALMKGRKLDD